jgi:Major royal jelly protein
VKIDLGTNKIVQMISFDETTAPPKSYLNDVRVDTKRDHAYITESGTGALIVVDLNTGTARRLLADHPSTKAEPDAEIIVDGMKIIDPKTAQTGNSTSPRRKFIACPITIGAKTSKRVPSWSIALQCPDYRLRSRRNQIVGEPRPAFAPRNSNRASRGFCGPLVRLKPLMDR